MTPRQALLMLQVENDEHRAIHERLYQLLLLIRSGDAEDDLYTREGQQQLEALMHLATLALCYNPCCYVTWDCIASMPSSSAQHGAEDWDHLGGAKWGSRS